jgi:PAS domain S-box-containing protein
MPQPSIPPGDPVNLPCGRRVSILLVDDQPAHLLALEAILEDLGHDLVRAHSGEEALRRLQGGDFAVVLLAAQMPGLDGFATARRIREQSQPTPILFLAAPGRRHPVEEAYALGAVDYLVQPVPPVVLRAKVALFVELFRKAEQVRQMEQRPFERRLGEETARLQESEQRFARFMQHLPGLAWIKDLQGRYVYANDAAAKAFRTPRPELYGKTDAEIFPPPTAAQFQENDTRALANGSGVQIIETLEHEDGAVHHSLVHKFPIPGPDGRPALVGGMAIDVTDRLRAEQAQRAAQEQLHIVTDSMSAPVTRCSADLTYLWVSRPYADWLGRAPEAIVGRPIAEVIGPEAFASLRPYFERVLAGQEVNYEEEINFRGLGRRWVNAVYTPTRDAAGRVDGWVAVVLDIDGRKRAEQALQEADRRKDEFLAMLAHELRNPLAPVWNALEILKMPGAPPQILRQARDMMERQVQHLVRLVDDLLDVSRIVRDRIELRREPVDLAAVFGRAVEIARPLIDRQHHQLRVSLPADPLLLEGDPVRLAQVVGNLLLNAAKYTDRGGNIALTGERAGGEVVIRVRDTGVGIDADLLPHVFDLFRQADRSLARSQGGLGIGLTVVKRLVEMHGGRVSAHSAGPGRGSEFVIRLPEKKGEGWRVEGEG